jgi:hypothetical protein
MDDTSGFYKLDGDLLFGPNFVMNKDYELRRETHAEHTYPIDGWSWFDTQAAARTFFGLLENNPDTNNVDQSQI